MVGGRLIGVWRKSVCLSVCLSVLYIYTRVSFSVCVRTLPVRHHHRHHQLDPVHPTTTTTVGVGSEACARQLSDVPPAVHGGGADLVLVFVLVLMCVCVCV